jgi:hypothetical protein
VKLFFDAGVYTCKKPVIHPPGGWWKDEKGNPRGEGPHKGILQTRKRESGCASSRFLLYSLLLHSGAPFKMRMLDLAIFQGVFEKYPQHPPQRHNLHKHWRFCVAACGVVADMTKIVIGTCRVKSRAHESRGWEW